MVTRLKDNLSYIEYIRKKVKDKFPEWKEFSVAFEGQPNNNFQINYTGKIEGYYESVFKLSFTKDRGLLELRLSYQNNPVFFGHLISNGIIENIPSQNKKWPLGLCVELIDYYIEFLELFFRKKEIL